MGDSRTGDPVLAAATPTSAHAPADAGLLELLGAWSATAIRAAPLGWAVAGAALVSSPLWALPHMAAVGVVVVATVALRIPWLPRALLRGPAALAFVVAVGAGFALFAPARRDDPPWEFMLGLNLAAACLWAVATARALRTNATWDDAVPRIVAWCRTRPGLVAFVLLALADPVGAWYWDSAWVADIALDDAGHVTGVWAISGAHSATIEGVALLLLAALAAGSSRGAAQSVVMAALANWVCWHLAAKFLVPQDSGTGWEAESLEGNVVLLALLPVAWMVRGVADGKGGRALLPIVAIASMMLTVAVDLPLTWGRETGELGVSLATILAAWVLSMCRFALLVAGLVAPIRDGTLVGVAALYGAVTALAAGLVWRTPMAGLFAMPILAAGEAWIAVIVIATRAVRRLDGVGVPVAVETDPAEDESLGDAFEPSPDAAPRSV